MREIKSREDLAGLLHDASGKHYVYVLRCPDNVPSHSGFGTPFYVGIGQRFRVFEHEQAAIFGKEQSEKADAIRRIYAAGKKPVRTIDSVHDREPWIREAELIHEIGRKSEGKGPLLNAQTYAPSETMNGVELRKYADVQKAAGSSDAIPSNFKLLTTRLKVGPNVPRSRTSVMGKVFTEVEKRPGITGEDLIRALEQIDFSSNKSAYTQSGQVCAAWLAGYVEGAFSHPRALYIQEYP